MLKYWEGFGFDLTPDIVQYGEIGAKAEIRALNSILWKFVVGWRRTKYMTKRDDTGLLRKTNGNRMAILLRKYEEMKVKHDRLI